LLSVWEGYSIRFSHGQNIQDRDGGGPKIGAQTVAYQDILDTVNVSSLSCPIYLENLYSAARGKLPRGAPSIAPIGGKPDLSSRFFWTGFNYELYILNVIHKLLPIDVHADIPVVFSRHFRPRLVPFFKSEMPKFPYQAALIPTFHNLMHYTARYFTHCWCDQL